MRRREFCRRVCGAGVAAATVGWRVSAGPRPADALTLRREMLVDAAKWLWSQQQADGAWHSEVYALLRRGTAISSFVLRTLLSVPVELVPRPQGGVERAVEFLLGNLLDEPAVLGRSDPDVLEYPNYSTADALRVLHRVDEEGHDSAIQRMRSYLASEQLTEGRGFTRGDAAYGGWGFGAVHTPARPGHVDLAHTRYVLEALAETGGLTPEQRESAAEFLAVLQKLPGPGREQPSLTPFNQNEILPVPSDGGFYFSPVVLAANKGAKRPTASDRTSGATLRRRAMACSRCWRSGCHVTTSECRPRHAGCQPIRGSTIRKESRRTIPSRGARRSSTITCRYGLPCMRRLAGRATGRSRSPRCCERGCVTMVPSSTVAAPDEGGRSAVGDRVGGTGAAGRMTGASEAWSHKLGRLTGLAQQEAPSRSVREIGGFHFRGAPVAAAGGAAKSPVGAVMETTTRPARSRGVLVNRFQARRL
ncbi:MAG: prenyltransferase/squalene oxidase repeat-containing protein [Planctomycetaceae bacterium]